MLRFYPFQMRGTAKPSVPLPLACRSVGHFRTRADWDDRIKRKDFVELFWGVAGSGVFTIDGVDRILGPDEVLTLYSGEVHHIRSDREWEYRWLTIDGELADAVARSFGLERQPRRAGPCPHGLFERLEREVADVSPAGQRTASVLAYEILTLASAHDHIEVAGWDQHVRRCADLIQQGFADPGLSVAAIAAQLGVERTRLCKVYQQRMKMAPSEHIAALRIAQALRLLSGTTLSIAEIAKQTGFASPGYFSSVVRRHTGRSPAELRRSASGSPGTGS